ncbi:MULTISPECIES: hypothetical protein [unclassified Lacinutrix]
MDSKKFLDCERKRFHSFIGFRLPHAFFNIGIAIATLAIVCMCIRAFLIESDAEWLKIITKQVLLIGMLVMSISKDKEEDEMTIALRAQSYAIAFVVGVLYAIILPYVEFGVSNIVHSGGESFKTLGDFQVLIFMLMIQLMFYHNLKRFR